MAENPFAQFAEDPEPTAANRFAQFRSDEPLEMKPADDPGMKQVAPGVFIRADRSLAQYITGAAEVLASVGSSALAEPVGGLAGIGAAIIPGGKTGAEAVESTREAMTFQPGTETGQEMMGAVGSFLEPVGRALGAVETALGDPILEATGSPVAASIAHTAPTALLEILGLGMLRKPSQAAKNAARAQERMKIDADMTPDQIARQEIAPEMRSHTQIAEDLRESQVKTVAQQVRPDEEIIAAAKELGVDLNPSHYSTNEAYRRVEQAIKQQPQSKLATKEFAAIETLGNRADELIGEFGGQVDKSLLDVNVRTQINGTIEELTTSAENAYARVHDAVKQNTRVIPRASIAYIDQRLKDMGDNLQMLSPSEKALHGLLNSDRITYGALDQIRRNVGAGFNRKGLYADDLSGNLDQVYSALIADQQGVASALGAGADFAAARKLVQTRKDLEKQAIKIFGSEAQKSILPALTQTASALTKGDVQKFKNLMEALPENLRTPAAATMLNDLFMSGTRKGGSIGAGFAKAYSDLQRNAGAKAELFKYLPAAAQKRFDAIGKVSEGLYRAKALGEGSPTARFILEALETGGMVSRLLDRTTDTVLGRMTFIPGPQRWLAAGMKASKDAAKRAFSRSKAADELMVSPKFNQAINKAMEGDVKQAEIMLKRSAVWQAFRNTLGEGTKAQLVAMGPIAWLTQQDAPAQPAPPEPVAADQTSAEAMPPVGPPAEIVVGSAG